MSGELDGQKFSKYSGSMVLNADDNGHFMFIVE